MQASAQLYVKDLVKMREFFLLLRVPRKEKKLNEAKS